MGTGGSEEDLGCGRQGQGVGRARARQVQRDSGTARELGTLGRGAKKTAPFQKGPEKGWSLETAEREEEPGFWQVLFVLGREMNTGLQKNTDRNRGTEATLGFFATLTLKLKEAVSWRNNESIQQ